MSHKKLALLTALALVLWAVCAGAETASQDFVATLAGNPTTGYTWQYVLDKEGVVTVEEQFFTSAELDRMAGIEPVGEPPVGQGGKNVFTVKGVKPGDVLLTLEYARSWEENSALAKLTYSLRVNEDLSVVCAASAYGME